MPERAGPLVAPALLALTVVELLTLDRHVPAAAVIAGLCVSALTAARARAPVTAALSAAVCTALALRVSPDAVLNTTLLSLAVLAFALGDRSEMPRSAAAAAAMTVATFGAQVAFDGGNSSPPLLFAVLGPWLAGSVLRSSRLLARRLEQTVDELAVERAAYVELAVERERRYIARELHDIVGHAMSVIVIQATAGRHLMRSDPALAHDALQAILDAGEQARTEVDRLRGILANEPAPGLDRLPEVVGRAAAAGLHIELRGSVATIKLSPEADAAALRVLQEALTNVIRHAHGADVTIGLELAGDHLHLEVHNGPGQAHKSLTTETGGEGLAGMAERVRAAGGRLETGPSGNGWNVLAVLPYQRSNGDDA